MESIHIPLNNYRYKRKGFVLPRFSIPNINFEFIKSFFLICFSIMCLGIFIFSGFVAYKIISYEEIKMQKIDEYINYKIYPIASKVDLLKEDVDFLTANAQIVEHRLKIRKYSIKNVNGKNKLVYE